VQKRKKCCYLFESQLLICWYVLCTFQSFRNFVDAAYDAFLSGIDDAYNPLFAELQKKVGRLFTFVKVFV